MIPVDIEELMKAQPASFGRDDATEVLRELEALAVQPEDELAVFYVQYRAVNIHSRRTSEELMDPAFPTPQLASATEFVRETYEVGDEFLCLTSGEGEGFYLYEIGTGAVFDVNVGELDDLERGRLQPRWSSFFELLRWYLS